jgi:hypothetical protein
MAAGVAGILGPQAHTISNEQLVSRGIGPYRLFKLSSALSWPTTATVTVASTW